MNYKGEKLGPKHEGNPPGWLGFPNSYFPLMHYLIYRQLKILLTAPSATRLLNP